MGSSVDAASLMTNSEKLWCVCGGGGGVEAENLVTFLAFRVRGFQRGLLLEVGCLFEVMYDTSCPDRQARP